MGGTPVARWRTDAVLHQLPGEWIHGILLSMSDSAYSVVAYIARYWFLLLALLIVWRAIVWLRKDADRVSRAQRSLPDAGYIGEWAVVASDAPGVSDDLVMRASRDGWLGSARACDVRLRDAGVPARAARFYLRPDGLHMLPTRSGILLVDGEPVHREAVLRHGATLTVGGVTMQLRLFAGVLLSGEKTARRQRRNLPPPETEDADENAVEQFGGQSAEEAGEGYVRLELPKPALKVKSRYSRRR